jgi:hypothetical protein
LGALALVRVEQAPAQADRLGVTSTSKLDCDVCKLTAQCCPNAVARKIPRDLHEDARDVAPALAATPQYVEACRWRKKVEMLFAHLKRILRLIPRLADQNLWAHLRNPMDMIFHVWSISSFQASQQCSTIGVNVSDVSAFETA